MELDLDFPRKQVDEIFRVTRWKVQVQLQYFLLITQAYLEQAVSILEDVLFYYQTILVLLFEVLDQ